MAARLVGTRNALVSSGSGAVASLAALGILERVLWNIARPGRGAAGEAMRVALAVGSGRGFADAYHVGQGPTAHLLPVSPGIAGLVYRLLGAASMPAETLLAAWSIGLALATYLLLYRAFGRLGTPRWARLIGLGYACLAPAYIGQEAVDFRVWDGGLAAYLAALFFDLLTAAASERELGPERLAATAVVCAVLFFVNPPLGAAAALASALYAARELSPRQTALAAGIAVGVLGLLVTPWAARNARVLHAPVLLRSNAGLELALADYPGAASAGDRKQQFLARLRAIHPSFNANAYRAVETHGEVAYSRGAGAEAKRWIAAHPIAAATLMLLHIRQTIAPQPWEFDVFGRNLSPRLRAALVDLASLAGVLGLTLGVWSRRCGWLYLATLLGTWVVITSPFQPVPRYTYLAYPFLVFCGADLLARARQAAAQARSVPARRGGDVPPSSGDRPGGATSAPMAAPAASPP